MGLLQRASNEELRRAEAEAREQVRKAKTRKQRISANRQLAPVLIELSNRRMPPS